MIKNKDKAGYMGQYLSEVHFNENESVWGDYEDISDLRKIKFRLGELIIYFNHLEHEIENILCDLLGSGREDETGMMIIGNMSYKQKCNLLKKYWLRNVVIIDKKGYKKLKNYILDVMSMLLTAGDIRNSCVHAHRYDRQEKENIRISTKFDEKGVKIIYREINIKTLDSYIKFIYELEYILDDLNEQINNFIYY